jgi:hypothetical protein
MRWVGCLTHSPDDLCCSDPEETASFIAGSWKVSSKNVTQCYQCAFSLTKITSFVQLEVKWGFTNVHVTFGMLALILSLQEWHTHLIGDVNGWRPAGSCDDDPRSSAASRPSVTSSTDRLRRVGLLKNETLKWVTKRWNLVKCNISSSKETTLISYQFFTDSWNDRTSKQGNTFDGRFDKTFFSVSCLSSLVPSSPQVTFVPTI